MQVFVNGKLAALKEDASFDYVSENRLFSGADDYTFTVQFPLRDCWRNKEIFGHINRMDVEKDAGLLECDIVDKRFSKHGSLAITEITDTEVKAQFLEGRSAQNFNKTLDEIYINELDLGAHVYSGETLSPENVLAPDAHEPVDVALPWIEDATGEWHNFVERSVNGWKWVFANQQLTWQPYLVFIIKRIAAAIGFGIDVSVLERDDRFRYLLICNSLKPVEHTTGGNSYNPGGSGSLPQGQRFDGRAYADLMPRWSVKEFFTHLENLLPVQFDFDYKQRFISCELSREVLENAGAVRIDSVVDEYSVAVEEDADKCEYAPLRKLAYADCSHRMWKYYSCPWYRDLKDRFGKHTYTMECASVVDFMEFAKKYEQYNYLGNARPGYDSEVLSISKAIDVLHWDTVFVEFPVHRRWVKEQIGQRGSATQWFEGYKYQLHPVTLNAFGPVAFQSDDTDNATEIPIVPAWLDFYNPVHPATGESAEAACWPKCLHIAESEKEDPSYYNGNVDKEEWIYLTPIKIIDTGEPESKEPAFDRIYLGWWDGNWARSNEAPYPHVDDIWMQTDSTSWEQLPFSLRLHRLRSADTFYKYDIDPTHKFTFKFLTAELPNPRALFYIRGKRYLCERLTATFSDNGMSQLVKGEFWPVVDV